ncbi:hypothetical protein J2046_001707 [Rhizobium petrolearium]|uniref:hypothetical protein n=1 Tax=Neorhizobium petrolearium TaxID=515361 RepID=UPI001FDDF39F|nr:hypothetical protein [Neorhizobium petrolearium]MBP1843453.1 hypothetical protein [Neorhizobium petrolearium]
MAFTDTVLLPSVRDPADDFEVWRAIPSAQKFMICPLILFDQPGLIGLKPARASTSRRIPTPALRQ